MTASEKKQLAKIYAQVEALANARLSRMVAVWRKRRHDVLKITFGMGTEAFELRGIPVLPSALPRYVCDAIDDVAEITRDYRLACPDDINTEKA